MAAGLAACRAHDLCARPEGLLLEDIESLVELRDAIDGLLAERIEAAHRREATSMNMARRPAPGCSSTAS